MTRITIKGVSMFPFTETQVRETLKNLESCPNPMTPNTSMFGTFRLVDNETGKVLLEGEGELIVKPKAE